MNKKQEMWKNAFNKINEKYITETAELMPHGVSDCDNNIKNSSRGVVAHEKSGNLLFIVAAAAAVVCCVIGVGVVSDSDENNVSVEPPASTVSNDTSSDTTTEDITDTKKRSLTLDDVRILAAKGADLTWSDFEQFNGADIGHGLYIMHYTIDDNYAVNVGGSLSREKPMYIYLISEKNDSKYSLMENGTEGLEEFLAEENSEDKAFVISSPVENMIGEDGYPNLTTYFGYDSWRGGVHDGIDIAWDDCYGSPIYAAADGRVKYVHTDYAEGYDKGLYLVIDHGGGYETLYAHCSEILVKEGEFVSAGEIIAKIGITGWTTGSHLHFEVIKNNTHVDPMTYMVY